MNKRQQELMEELYNTLRKMSIEYQNDDSFKMELDRLHVFHTNVVDAYNTSTTYSVLSKK